MKADKVGLRALNRSLWIGLFLGVSTILVWLEWRSETGSAMGWFLVLSLWSALCGIGFTIVEWWLGSRGSKVGSQE